MRNPLEKHLRSVSSLTLMRFMSADASSILAHQLDGATIKARGSMNEVVFSFNVKNKTFCLRTLSHCPQA